MQIYNFIFQNLACPSDSEIFQNLLVLFSQKEKGCYPPPVPLNPEKKKASAFSFRQSRGSLALPLLAQNRRRHDCLLDSDFEHHEAGSILSGALPHIDFIAANAGEALTAIKLVSSKCESRSYFKGVVGGEEYISERPALAGQGEKRSFSDSIIVKGGSDFA